MEQDTQPARDTERQLLAICEACGVQEHAGSEAISTPETSAKKATKADAGKKPLIRVAVVEANPLWFLGFQAVFGSQQDFELMSSSLPDIEKQQNMDLVLLGDCSSQNLSDVMTTLKSSCPGVRIIVMGSGMKDETILDAIAFGATGYVDSSASPTDFGKALRMVSQGSAWAPRRVLSMLIERTRRFPGHVGPAGPCHVPFTEREQEVLDMLVAGRSNKKISALLGIRVRTVKAHVAKLMRKAGVQNRIALSIQAIIHSKIFPASKRLAEEHN